MCVFQKTIFVVCVSVWVSVYLFVCLSVCFCDYMNVSLCDFLWVHVCLHDYMNVCECVNVRAMFCRWNKEFFWVSSPVLHNPSCQFLPSHTNTYFIINICFHILRKQSSHFFFVRRIRTWTLSGVNFINMLICSFYVRKCCGAQLLFHQQNYVQLYQYAQLEVTPNFYVVCSKISVNLLA